MKPGRDLDTLVAEKVMEIANIRNESECPHYSTSIGDAWLVMEEIRTKLDPLRREWMPTIEHRGNTWRCDFELAENNAGDDITYYFAEANTAPLAICLATLKAKGIKI